MAREDLLELLGGQRGLGRYLMRYLAGTSRLAEDNQNDVSDDHALPRASRRRRAKREPVEYPPVPSALGTELMSSGVFGTTEINPSRMRAGKSYLLPRLLARELGHTTLRPGKTLNPLMAQVMLSLGVWT